MISGTEAPAMAGDRQRKPHAADAAAGSHSAAESRLPIRERKVVLVVEDDAADRDVYGRILLYNGFDVAFAADATEALRLASTHHPDLVLLDIGLPDGSGEDLCARLSATVRPGTTMPILVLSGYTRDEMGARMVAAGACEYIEKPASPVSVLHTVEEYLGQAPLAGDGAPPRILAEVE